MDYYIIIWSVVVFVENRIQSGFLYTELEKATGFSISHIRSVFRKLTGKSLSRYVLSRRISHAAFDIIHSESLILNIALNYGFNNPDTFTRAFFRFTGFTPHEFRKQRRTVGSIKLCSGVYGVSERTQIMDSIKNKATGSVVLYGVPKVGYGIYGCTPFPICLKGAANYLGEDIDYDYAMASSGAAFRLVWDETCWNGGNVDVLNTFNDPIMVIKHGIEALGRKFTLIGRENRLTHSDPAKFSSIQSNATKADFIEFIKEQIDKGHPCIGLGFIGPPEACLITGYRDDGQTILGWNFFQDSPQFASRVKIDDSGYFITDSWWENEETIAVMSIGDKVSQPMSLKNIIQNSIAALSGRKHGDYAKGIMAYDAWKRAITDENQFPKEPVMPLLAERLMCQGDAMDCLADGRHNAGVFFEKLSNNNPDQPLFKEIAEKFKALTQNVYSMYETLGGWQRDEKQMIALAKAENRRRIAEFIDKCKVLDEEALSLLFQLEKLL